MSGAAAFFSIAKDIATTIIAGIALYIACQGLSTWRRQLKGNAEYDVARKLIFSAYKLRDALEGVRVPGIHSMETAHALKETGISLDGMDDRTSLRTQKAAVYQLRWRPVQDAKNELRLNSLEARALLGDEAEAAFREANSCVQKLWAAIIVEWEFERNDVREEAVDIIARRKILYPMATKPEEDSYMVEVNKAVERFEKLAKPHLTFERG